MFVIFLYISPKLYYNHIVMYDNIYIKYSDSKLRVTMFTAYFVVLFLKYKIRTGDQSAQNYALLAHALQRYDEIQAYKYALKAIRLEPDYAYAHAIAGDILYNYNKYHDAEKYLLKSLELAGEDYYIALVPLILMYIECDDWTNAYKYSEKMLKIQCDDPVYLELNINVSLLMFNKENIWPRLSDFIKNCIKYKIFPGSIEVLLMMFNITAAYLIPVILRFNWICNKSYFLADIKKDYAGAVEFLLFNGEKYKKYRDYCFDAAMNIYYDLKEYKKCINIANRILLKHKYIDAYRIKMKCYRKLEDYEKALECIDKAQKAFENQDTVSYDLLRIYTLIEKQDYPSALSIINKILLSNPGPLIYKAQGDCLFCLKRFEEAVKVFEKMSKENLQDEYALFMLSRAYYQLGEQKRALQTINKALLINKDHFNYELKGNILSAMNKFKEADICYLEAKKLKNIEQ